MENNNIFYTAYNIWFENLTKVYSINYKKGNMIPAGTKVTNIVVNPRDRHPNIQFNLVENRQLVIIYFQASFHPGLNINDFEKRLFTVNSLEELTSEFTDQEKQCIQRGTVFKGISKKTVLVILGYPPEHFTLNLEGTKWYYWINRFKKKEILFDENGIALNGF